MKLINLTGYLYLKIEAYHDISVERRMNEDIPFITDNGNYILDCELKSKIDVINYMNFNSSHRCARNRLFLDMTTQAIIGTQEGIKVINKK